MDQPILYASNYAEGWFDIYEGIFQHRSTHGNKIYPVLRNLGCINIITRKFIKGSKHPRKIIRQEGDKVVLFHYGNSNYDTSYTYTPLNILLTQLNHPDTLLNEITNVAISISNDKKIRSHYSGCDPSIGIVDF
jgi:hypothetical protein